MEPIWTIFHLKEYIEFMNLTESSAIYYSLPLKLLKYAFARDLHIFTQKNMVLLDIWMPLQ